MASVMDLWQTWSRRPAGTRLFSWVFARRAPYFSTVAPKFVDVRAHRVELVVPKRRKVLNHIGTVHAIALCNGLEAAMGALAEVTIPADKRWLPKGMQVSYTAKADSDVTCVAQTSPEEWADLPADSGADLPVRVSGRRSDGTVVIEGVITLWVSPRKK